MKLLFVRHGESVDDLTDQYGGWGDFDLTPKGKVQIQETAEKIKELGISFDKVLTSPLLRAWQSGMVIANTLSIPLEIFLYAKEKNGNGLLSGMNREEAREDYPELVNALEQGYVYGAEPQEMFIERVKFSVSVLLEKQAKALIVVTHGGYMGALFKEILHLEYQKTHDGGFILLEGDHTERLKINTIDGIDYKGQI